jgi:hypothetical protein
MGVALDYFHPRQFSLAGSSVEIISTPVGTLPKVGDVAVSAFISGQHYIFFCPPVMLQESWSHWLGLFLSGVSEVLQARLVSSAPCQQAWIRLVWCVGPACGWVFGEPACGGGVVERRSGV